MKKLITLVTLLSLQAAWAIPEANYKADYQRLIVPLLKEFKHNHFEGAKNTPIHYLSYKKPQHDRCVVILPGRSEQAEKYAEVIHSLNLPNASFFVMDHRGQGSSGRFLPQIDKGHVDDFDNYSADVKTFFDEVISDQNCTDVSLLAHSMGGGIATDFLVKYPDYVDRAVLVSPMLKVLTKPYPYGVARAIVLGSMTIGRGSSFAVGQKPFDSTATFESNVFTNSQVRFDMWMNMFEELPQTKIGGVTNRWLNEVMKGTKRLRGQYSKLKLPLKVFIAADEQYSDPKEMQKLCERAANCDYAMLNGRHELLMEKDAVRDVLINDITEFFN